MMKYAPYILLAVVPAALAPVFANDGLTPLFDRYHQMQSALATDDFDAARLAARQFHDALSKVKVDHLETVVKHAWKKQHHPLADAAGSAGKAGDIEALRKNFEHVSMAMIALAEVAGPKGFRHFRCPMAFDHKGADWLQKGAETNNPYFGSRMLRCGMEVKTNPKNDQHQH